MSTGTKVVQIRRTLTKNEDDDNDDLITSRIFVRMIQQFIALRTTMRLSPSPREPASTHPWPLSMLSTLNV